MRSPFTSGSWHGEGIPLTSWSHSAHLPSVTQDLNSATLTAQPPASLVLCSRGDFAPTHQAFLEELVLNSLVVEGSSC